MRKPTRDLRFERWLLLVKTRLVQRLGDVAVALYDGPHHGDRIALTGTIAGDLVELLVSKQEDGGAVLALVAETHPAAQAYAEALAGLHEEVRRLENAKRRFVHRIERMAQYLASTFAPRAEGAPREELAKLQRLFPEAKLLVGLEARFRTKEKLADAGADVDDELDLRKGLRKRHPSKYGARVTTNRPRAALFDASRGLFVLGAPAARTVAEREREHGIPAGDCRLLVLGLPMTVVVAQGQEVESGLGDLIDAVDLAGDVAGTALDAASSASSSCPDIGGLSLPDCNGIDLPDCGGLDCGS